VYLRFQKNEKQSHPCRLQVSVHEDEFGLADVSSDDHQTSSHLSRLELKKLGFAHLKMMTTKTTWFRKPITDNDNQKFISSKWDDLYMV